MTAREEILNRVRAAIANSGQESVPLSRDYPAARRGGRAADAPTLFCERVAEYRAEVVRCVAADTVRVIADSLAGSRAIVPPGLPWPVLGAVKDSGQTAAELEEFDAVVTCATLGIAATGTVVLTHGPGEGRRALTLMPDLHVCVVTEGQVVPGVVEAVRVLDPTRPQTWVSGPSATSDIELRRVEGVHGPRKLIVICVGP